MEDYQLEQRGGQNLPLVAIRLNNDQLTWEAGSTLSGTISYTVLYSGYQCSALTLELRGIEESNFSEDLGGRANIIKLTFPIREWTDE